MVTAHVEEREGTYVVVDASGADVSTHASRDEALTACARACGALAKEPVLRVDGAPSAAWRWLDASVPESAADFPDGHLDLTTLEEVAAQLNAAPMPVPVTGGYVSEGSPSKVHGTSHDSATAANGWAHSAAFMVRGGVPHMYLFAELLREVAVEVDRGRLAFGSVEVTAKSREENGAIRGAKLIAHALTNAPANRYLTPSSSIRSEALVMRASPTLLQGSASMPKLKNDKPAVEEKPAPEAVRAEAPPVAEEPSGEVSVDKDAMIAELEAKIAELTAQVDAMRSEMEARAAEAPTEEEAAKEAEAKREAEIKTALDTAEAEGRILKSTREGWEKVARASGIAVFTKLTAGLRSIPTRQVLKRGEASPTPATKRALDKNDPYVVAMRAAGLSDEKIAARLAANVKEI